jgi:hypothetical protein
LPPGAGTNETKEHAMKRAIVTILAVAGAVAAFWPAAGSAAGFQGVVVAKQHGTLLVVSPAGALRAVHARASIGARLVGTTVVGRATHARIHGIVVRRIGTTLVLSSNRHLIAIPNRVGRRLADHSPAPTTTSTVPGSVVNADVTIANGQIEEVDEDDVGQVGATTLTIQATVKAVAAGSVTLDVQGQSVTVPLPAGLTLPATLVGQTVTLNVSLDDQQGDDEQGDDHGGHRGHDGGGDDD